MVEPSMVMLDEPMAGVNPALTQSLLEHVKDLPHLGMTVLFVEHDMDVVMDISDWVVVMGQGRVIAEGPPQQVSKDPAVIDAYLGSDHGDESRFAPTELVGAIAEASLAAAAAGRAAPQDPPPTGNGARTAGSDAKDA